MADLWLTLGAHVLGMALAVFGGGAIVGFVLKRMRLVGGETHGSGL
jgi:hypothetical protein